MKTLTWDRGLEMRNHTRISIATDLDIYFCDPSKVGSGWPVCEETHRGARPARVWRVEVEEERRVPDGEAREQVEVGRRRPGAASTGAAVTGVAARAGSSAFIRKAVYGRTEQEARAKLIEALAARQAGGLPGQHAEVEHWATTGCTDHDSPRPRWPSTRTAAKP